MYDKRQYLSKYCDIQTKDGVWRLGMVEGEKLNKLEKNIIEVSLDGWSSNKTHKVCLHSNRIQPPRLYSREYTGQKSFPLRNANIEMMQISYIENWLKLFYKFDFQNFPILDITNLFRCQMFVLVDAILFHDWHSYSENLEEDLKKIENFFNNIVQFSVLYLEKMPKFTTDIYNTSYERYSYLESLPVSYLEASYELFKILKNIFGFADRTANFFKEYSEILNTNFLSYFIDIGCMNLFSRFFREYKPNKLFEEKFYILSNIINLNLLILNKSNHNKLNKTNQIKYITEIVDFLYRENFIVIINKNMEDPDVIELVDSIVEFAKLNKKFIRESSRFEIFLHNINKYDLIFKDEKMLSEKNLGRFLPSNLQGVPAGGLSGQNICNDNLLNKLNDIESKLATMMENKIDLKTPKKNNNLQKNISKVAQVEFQKTMTSQFFIFSPHKIEKMEKNNECDDIISDNLLINSENSFFSVSDPSDEYSVLNLMDNCLSFEDKFDKTFLRKIIKWRKRILEISKRNGWIVGKILAANTIRNFEIDDRDIIKANLVFMEKYSLIDKDNFKIDYNDVLKDYEDLLINSLNDL